MATAIVAPTSPHVPATGDFSVTTLSDARGLWTIRIRGVLDAAGAHALRRELALSAPTDGTSVLLDLAGVTTVAPECHHVLVAHCARLRRAGVRVAVLAADPVMPALTDPVGGSFTVSVTAATRVH